MDAESATESRKPALRELKVGPFPWWMRGGHLETVLASALTLPIRPFDAERHLVEVAPNTCVETWWSKPAEPRRGSLLIAHGLGGSAQRPHVLAMADEALRRGWHAVRVNLRNHGGTEHLASTLFSAAQSDDLGVVLEAMEARGLPRPYVITGASLGANMALRYAALAGDDSRADVVVAMNPALDFFVIERQIHRPSNFVYRLNFVLGLCRVLNAIREIRPVPGPPADLRHIRSIREFDHHFTAPAAGFPDVDAYYRAAGAGSVMDRLRVPTLLLTACNDPFIPAPLIARHHGDAEGRVQVILTDRGGHVGYRVRDRDGEGSGDSGDSGDIGDGRARFWAARPALGWIEGGAGSPYESATAGG